MSSRNGELVMSKKNYDQRLKNIRKKIEKILTEADVAGLIVLQSDTHAEFSMKIDANWSVAKFEHDGKGIRVRSKKEDFESPEEQHRCTQATIGMLLSFKDLGLHIYQTMGQVEEQLRKHIVIFHPILSPRDIYTGDGDDK